MKILTPLAIVLFLAAAVYVAVLGWSAEPAVSAQSSEGGGDTASQGASSGNGDGATPAGTESGPASQAIEEAASNPAISGPPLQLTGEPPKAIGTDPNSWFEATRLQLGTYYQFEKAEGTFRFKNPTDEPRKLTNLRQSCHCTKSTFLVGDREYYLEGTADNPNTLFRVMYRNGVRNPERVDFITVNPGEEGIIHVEMEMQGTRGPRGATLNFNIDDPEIPNVLLSFEAIGALFFDIIPEEVNLNQMSWEDVREFEVQVSSPVFDDFEITGLDDVPPGMKVEYEKSFQNGRPHYTIKGTYGPMETPNASGARLTFHTNQRGLDFTIPVLAVVEGPITLEPAGFIALGRVRQGTAASKTVSIIPGGEFDLQVEKWESKELSFDEEFLDVSWAKSESGAVEVSIGVKPGVSTGTVVRGEVVVHLNHPAARTQSILFNGFVR